MMEYLPYAAAAAALVGLMWFRTRNGGNANQDIVDNSRLDESVYLNVSDTSGSEK